MSSVVAQPETAEAGLSRLEALYAASGVFSARRGDTLYSHCVGLGHTNGRDSDAVFETRIRGGKIVGICQACRQSLADYVANLGGNLSDLMPRSEGFVPAMAARSTAITVAANTSRGAGPVENVYTYTDANGAPVFEVWRHRNPKTFRPHLPGRQAEGIGSIARTDQPIYRLPEVRAAIERGETVFIAEGEKDADALASAGVVATCNAFGAQHWRSHHTLSLAGVTSVVLIAHKDAAGAKRCIDIAADLEKLDPMPEVLIAEAAGGPEINDAADHLAAGYAVEDFDLVSVGDLTDRLASVTSQAATDLLGVGSALAPLSTLPIETTVSGELAQASQAVLNLQAGLARGLSGLAALPPPEWLIDFVLPARAVALLFGSFSTGKSFVAEDMAASVSHGFSWLGLPTKKVRVIYVVGEGVSDAHSRTAAWCGARGVDDVPDMLFATVPPNLTATEQVVWLIVTAREFDAGLIVIDTLAKSMPGVEENSAKEMGQIVSTLYEIVRETGATVLLVHHTGHSDKERARGSITLPSGVDAALALHNNMHEKAVKIWVYKQKFARSAYYLPASRLFDSPAGTAPTLVHGIDLTAPEPSESADRAADVIEVLRAAGRPMSTDGIRKGVGARLDSVRNALFALERAGLVASRVTGGKGMAVLWHLIDPTDGNQASLEVA